MSEPAYVERNRRTNTVPAITTIVAFSGDIATCDTQVAGSILPAELPTGILLAHGLREGDRFLWWIARDGTVNPEDIDDLPAIELTRKQKSECEWLVRKDGQP